MRLVGALALGVLLSITCTAQSGPFGFQKGMTRTQIVHLVGQSAVDIKHSSGDTVTLKTAPKPNSRFDSYVLLISPTDGLVKVLGIGSVIQTGDDGSDLKSAYDDVVEAVTQKYGEPTNNFDVCNGGTGCSDSQYWMLSLMEKNRTVACYWLQPLPSQAMKDAHVHGIGVKIEPLSINSGYVSVGYEFEGFSDYLDKKKAAENSSF